MIKIVDAKNFFRVIEQNTTFAVYTNIFHKESADFLSDDLYPRSDLFLNLSSSYQYFALENSFNPVPFWLFHVIYYYGGKKVSLTSV